ncbi:hypothetical protein E4631_25615 [Hymenobacter sp. UV11]|uniref:hypothetical protein n=1 Tax=Hymenobacter sp. UV11 TaxID=1849735 RepID=UPI00105BDE49|nr:hypothetical protein [Hymenobacter sp. UV11]TDN39167.1 hypothetical protein A8B98_00070 [Hymenobacter sp. UV11]TFZ62068.1 hypothetical protein E4631_25615 [Hymenobacter sp. UV11]
MKLLRLLPNQWLAFFFSLLLVTACKKEDSNTATPATDDADAYVFPIVPGTPAWAALTSGAAMIQACQVPPTVLQQMSTPGLVTTCLNYPLLNNMIAFNTLQRGVRSQLTNFNGFAEFQQRPDAAQVLVTRYQQQCTACVPPPADWGKYSLHYSYFEMVLAQDEFLTQLSSAQRHDLVRLTLAKYAEKQREIANYAIFGLKTTAFLLARIMQADQYAPFLAAVGTNPPLATFTKDAEIYGQMQVLDAVVTLAKTY